MMMMMMMSISLNPVELKIDDTPFIGPARLVHLRAVAEWTWLPPLQVQAPAPAMKEWKPTLWCSASAPPEFHQFSGSNHGIRNISSWTFRSMISLDVWWPQPLWTPLWPRDEKQHQPIQLTHNPPKPSTTKEHGRHGLAIQVLDLQVRVPTSLMKPIGFSPSFCLEICKFWTFRSLAFFFRAFRLLEVLAGAAAYQRWECLRPITILVDGKTLLFGIDIKIVNWGIARDWFINHSWWAYQLLSIPASTLRPLAYCSEIEPSGLRTATILSCFLLLPCLCLPSRVTTPLQSLQQMRPVASALGAHRLLPDAISIRFPNFVHWLMSLVATRKMAPKNCQKSPQISL